MLVLVAVWWPWAEELASWGTAVAWLGLALALLGTAVDPLVGLWAADSSLSRGK